MDDTPCAMMVKDARSSLVDVLQKAAVDEAVLYVELLLAEVMHCARLECFMRSNEWLSSSQVEQLNLWVDRLAQHEPLQYVLGYTEFRGVRFDVDPRVLIPRSETELLIDLVLQSPVMQRDAVHGADVGAGSGCIVVSLVLEGPKHVVWMAVDKSDEALSQAQDNARRHHVADRIQWRNQSLLTGQAEQSLDVIVANLPYISSDEMTALERNVADYEPCMALYGGSDGLDLIRILIDQGRDSLTDGGMIFLEIGWAQGDAVCALFDASFWGHVRLKQDYAGRDRFVCAERKRRCAR